MAREIGYEELMARKAHLEKIANSGPDALFISKEGDIDKRDAELLNVEMHPGFKGECGIRGSKLSGGQK